MEKLIFQPEEFEVFTETNEGRSWVKLTHFQAASIANARLEQMLKEAPVLHCRQQGSLWIATESQDEYDTHKARLVQIEELK